MTEIECVVAVPKTEVYIPRVGLGVYKSRTPAKSCEAALRAGYRHIDSAQYYKNEEEVAEGVLSSGVAREEIFLTTKILNPCGDPDSTYNSIVSSVAKIGGSSGYVDLFLIHHPENGPIACKELWLALERAYAEGKCRSIGVSNYGIQHIEQMKPYAQIWPPHVNQIELHPWCQQREIVEYCTRKGIILQAYSPLARSRRMDDPVVEAVAQKHNKNSAQVLIRYSLQKGWVTLPKSDTPERITSNIDVFDFSLTEEDMSNLDSLDEGRNGAVAEAVEN